MTLVPELLRVARELEPVIYAVILIAVMFLLPGGLITLPDRLRGKKKYIKFFRTQRNADKGRLGLAKNKKILTQFDVP